MVDAPAVLEYLLRTAIGRDIATIVEAPDTDLHTPALCDVEVSRGLDRAVERGLVTPARAASALRLYADLPVTRHGHVGLLERMAELAGALEAERAAYVALGERLDATVLTADRELTRAARELLSINVISVAA